MRKWSYFFLVISTLMLAGCNSGNALCNNRIVSVVESPDNKYSAFVFVRNCGSTTKESYQLSVLPRGK
jgi:hypothetical protein